MSFNFNKPKVPVIIVLAMIALVAILVVSTNIIKNKVVVNKIRENIEQGSANLDLGKVKLPKQIVKSKQIGYISKVYEEGGKRYLRFDDVKFLMGKEAIEAAKKNGDAQYENGEYFVYDDYYIVNSSEKTKNYMLDDKALLNLLGCWIDPYNGDVNNHSVSFNNFKNVSSKNDHMLCYIHAENNVVVKVEGQYTP